MDTTKLPKFKLLKHTQLEHDNVQSALISMLRGLAALQVAAAHLRAEIFPGFKSVPDPTLWYQGLALMTGFAHQAVVVFFLISGWLVGGSLLNKIGQPQALTLYAIDRITRLWTVLLPTFLLMIVFGMLTGTVLAGQPDLASNASYSLPTLLGNLVGLQTISVPNFGDNFVLWSLANETWYYLMFPLMVLMFIDGSAARRLLATAALALSAWVVSFPILLYLAVWMLGVGASRLRMECSNTVRVLLFALLGLVSLYYRVKGSNDDLVPASFVQDVVFSVAFLLFLLSMQVKTDMRRPLMQRFKRSAEFLSNFSFTLYVIHVPLIGLASYYGMQWFGSRQLSPADWSSVAIYLGLLAAIVALAYLSYLAFEANTYRVRRLLKQSLLQRGAKPAAAAPLSAKPHG